MDQLCISRISGAPKYILRSCVDCFPFLFQWLRLIVENRPSDNPNDEEGLDDINDIRNGVFTLIQIHGEFDQRRVVVLKVCQVIIFLFFV